MKSRCGILVLAIFALAAFLRADGVKGKDHILCSTAQAARCTSDGECKIRPPLSLNIPQFFEFNLKDRSVATTKASGETRSTPIQTLMREGGLIVLQGAEDGLAFSFVIEEGSGMASLAVAGDEMTVSVFGVCTPVPSGQ